MHTSYPYNNSPHSEQFPHQVWKSGQPSEKSRLKIKLFKSSRSFAVLLVKSFFYSTHSRLIYVTTCITIVMRLFMTRKGPSTSFSAGAFFVSLFLPN